MSRPSSLARGLAVALYVAALWLALRYAAGAQERPSALAVDLARVCAGEAGIQSETGDCAALVHVVLRRAERHGMRPAAMARAYSGRHLGVEASPRPWIAGLRADGAAPLEWPASAPPWSRYRASWLELVQHVGRVLDGDVLDPCPGADHWGMRSGVDWERARRAGWELLECDAETRNAFWRVPRRPQGDVL